MARNIEIKAQLASAADAAALRERARALVVARGGAPEQLIDQDDSFFVLPAGRGRLKLRQFADGSAELIHYHRADDTGAKASDYVRVPVGDGEACREALSRALGLLGRVRKRRVLLMAGRTRIHLDAVEGLGDFMELEVVLQDGEPECDGADEAEALLTRLGIAAGDLVQGAYLDLLAAPGSGAGANG